MTTPSTSGEYYSTVRNIAEEAEGQAKEDRERFIQESVDGSEWTFKPRLSRLVMAWNKGHFDNAYEAMHSNVMEEVKV